MILSKLITFFRKYWKSLLVALCIFVASVSCYKYFQKWSVIVFHDAKRVVVRVK